MLTKSAVTTASEWPRVSWLMPVLNGMPYLRELLDSLVAQTYPNHEIIVWDNGSTDGSVELLQAYIPSRIVGRVVVGQPLPLGICRGRLMETAQTEFCAAIDADDVHHPTRLARQVAYMRDHPSLVALGCLPQLIDDRGNPLPDWEYPTEDAEIRWRTRWQSSLNAPSTLVRRDAVLRVGNYRNLNTAEDLDLWMRMAQIGPMHNLSDRLVQYRRHLSNTTAQIDDYYFSERQIAEANAATLFPGLDASAAIDLWQAAYPHHERHAVRFHHFAQLQAAAHDVATAIGKPRDYFTSTAYFRRQRRAMIKNFVYPYTPSIVWNVLGKVRGRPSPKRSNRRK
jgi:glycosyltransferase involved in cell wall biosynthesis